MLDEEASRPFFRRALEAGINFFDTADMYSDGASEEVIGRALKDFAQARRGRHRDEGLQPDGRRAPTTAGLSRKHIFDAIDASLRRLRIDYVDLYQIHRFDSETPIEETLDALDDLVRSGKVRYIGASSMYAWQFAQVLDASRTGTAGRGSSRCRTTTTSSTARRSARCSRSAAPRGSA